MLASIKYLYDHGIVRRDPECVAPPSIIHLLILSVVLEHSFPYQGPIVGYRYCPRWHICSPDVLSENSLVCDLQCPTFQSSELLTSAAGSLGYVAPEGLDQKGHSKPVDLW